MPNTYFDIKEVARLLEVDWRQVNKMAQRGDIPCQKVSGMFRFNQAKITDWLQSRVSTLGEKDLSDLDSGHSAQRKFNHELFLVSNMLSYNLISTELPARTRSSTIRELVNLAGNSDALYCKETLLTALNQREEISSTAMAGGVAIPHPKRPLPFNIEKPLLIIAHTTKGIGFGAPDGKMTDLFFMTCSPDDQTHIHILARLCRLFYKTTLVNDLRAAASADEYIDLITQQEQKILNEI